MTTYSNDIVSFPDQPPFLPESILSIAVGSFTPDGLNAMIRYAGAIQRLMELEAAYDYVVMAITYLDSVTTDEMNSLVESVSQQTPAGANLVRSAKRLSHEAHEIIRYMPPMDTIVFEDPPEA